MATLAQLRSIINRKVQDPNNTARTAQVVTEEINRAIRYYEKMPFSFNERLTTLSTVAGTQRLSGVPTDSVHELVAGGLILIDSQVRINLIKLHQYDFAERDNDQTGRPVYYTYRDQSYDLLPIPDAVYTVQFRYLQAYDDLSADSDTNDFTNYAEDLIVAHVLARLTAEDKQTTDLAAYYEELRLDELRALRERTDSLISAGYLQTQTMLDDYYYW